MRHIHRRCLRWLSAALLVFGGVFLLSVPVLAQNSLVADNLMQEAKECYDNGSHEKAIQLFSKVLLVQPRNKEALRYLKKMGLDGGIYGYHKTMPDHIYDLMEEIHLYEQDLNALEARSRLQSEETEELKEARQRLEELIRNKEEERQRLEEDYEEFYAIAAVRFKEQKEDLTRLQETAEQKTQELVRLNTDLFESKQQWLSDRETLGETSQELASVKKEMDDRQKASEARLHEMKMQYEQDVMALQKRRDELEHEMFQLTDDRDQKVRRFDDALRKKSAELTLEQGRLAVAGQQLARRESQLLKAQEEIRMLYAQRADLAGEAAALRDHIDQLKREQAFRRVSAPSDDKKVGLIAHVKKQDTQIMELKIRLAALLDEMDAAGKVKETSAETTAALQEQIRSLRSEIADKERELVFSKEQARSLEGRVSDYQERLEIVEGMIKDKEDRILFLEQELGAGAFLGGE